ncbi:MAG: phosphatidylserine decarboxylase family protein [Chitinophagales bacterium]|jgi:phosphatidylserine decarboxylase|nr:phosphatidylserine decarboxylase family protein [Chitinophagales bacterium]
MNYLHKEGRSWVIGLFVATAAISWLVCQYIQMAWLVWGFNILIWAFWFIIAQFFRNPSRKVVAKENQVVAPADGKVVVIEEVFEPEYFKDKRIQVSVFMSPINVHVNRNPISGIVSYFKYHPGLYLVAWHPKSSTENERTTVVFKNSKTEILVRQIAGALAKRICWYVKEGDAVQKGEDFGFIKFGSRVDLYFPLGTQIDVKIGDKVKGNLSVLATI